MWILRLIKRMFSLLFNRTPSPTGPSTLDPASEARGLNDLLRIRAANRDSIESVNGNLGTALGYKWSNGHHTNHPCIIIFVPRKLPVDTVSESERAPTYFRDPDGTWCYTDIVTGGQTNREAIEPLPELSEENKHVVQELKSGHIGLVGGIQLAVFEGGLEDNDHAFVGTAGIAVRHKETGRLGFLTNQHVADVPGRRIDHPWHNSSPIGLTYSTREEAPDEHWYEGVINEEDSYVRCDAAFVEVDEDRVGGVQPGLHVIGSTSPLLRIDPKNMDLIGQMVISVGRTRGVQKGTVAAYAYEWHDEDNKSVYTDILIIGEEGKAFSAGGDSGKIIVTDDDNHRPIALLWGGAHERLRHGREQEKWPYAIDLGKVLDRLTLELM